MAQKGYWNKDWEDPWQNLIYYMELRNMSFQQLAEASGVKQGTIEGWRNNRIKMMHAWAESIVRVCEALHVQPSYMLGLAADPKRVEEEMRRRVSPEDRVLQIAYGTDDVGKEMPAPRTGRKKRVENKPGKNRK